MARWAGEGKDWIKLMAHQKPRREDVIRSLLESMKQAVEKKAEPNGTRPSKKPRDLLPFVLGILEACQCPTREIKGGLKNDRGLGKRSRQNENEGWYRGEYPKSSTGMLGLRNSLAT